MNKKKVLRSTLIGFVLLLLSLVITGLVGISNLINSGSDWLNFHVFYYGFANTLTNYWLIWRPGYLCHETAYIGQVLLFVAIFLTLGLIIVSLVKKKPLYILPALLLGACIAFFPFLLLLVIPMVQLGKIGGTAMALLSGVTGLTMFATFFEVLAVGDMLRESLALLKKAGGEEAKDEPKQEQAQAQVVEGLSEEEVRKIVEKYLQEHVEEKHAEQPAPAPAPAPAKEPEPQPEPEEPEEEEEEEEEAEEAAPADDNSPVGLNIKGKRRRASFETRLKNSEFDIRHKYYDLRDYIKWYGLRNRISIPGDTFSYKPSLFLLV